jgi:hypothetical protein
MLDIFDQVLIINLASRPDRWSEIQTQFQAIGCEVDGHRIARFDAVRPLDAAGFPSLGARGCYLSHLGALRQARDAGVNRLLIIEDDLDFCRDFKQRWDGLRDDLDSGGWSFFYGVGEFDQQGLARTKAGLLKARPDTQIGTTPFVGLSRDGIMRSIAFLEAALLRPPGSPEGGPMHVDGAYNWVRRLNPSLETLMAAPHLGSQRPSRTDIHQLKWFDQLPGIRGLANWARRMRAKR